MPVTKEEFLARMAAGRAKKAAERASAVPAPAPVAPKPKVVKAVAPVTTIKAITPATAEAPAKKSRVKAISGKEAVLA
jgi:hypothetical protein